MAELRMEATSDPLEGSVRQKAAKACPVGERTGSLGILTTRVAPPHPQAVPCNTVSSVTLLTPGSLKVALPDATLGRYFSLWAFVP
jgi:hypothetical protein